MQSNLNTGLANEAYSNKIQAQTESTYCGKGAKQGETSMKWLPTCHG